MCDRQPTHIPGHCPPGPNVPEPKSSPPKEEWAIRDEATGKWWGHQSPITGLGWGSAITRHASYSDARNSLAWSVSFLQETARIVPVPPREMSDAEAIEWAKEEGISLDACTKGWLATYVVDGKLLETDYYCETLYGAIRAARRKLEGK